MAKKNSWWERLLGKNQPEEQAVVIGDLVLVPSGQTDVRAKMALPGTRELEPLLYLVPPPIDLDLVKSPNQDLMRDYGPNPVAEWALTFEATEPFDCTGLAESLHATHERFGRPTYYVRTPEGRITYLSSSDAPPRGVALIPAWSLGSWAKPDAGKIFAGAQALAATLSKQSESFVTPEISFQSLEKQMGHAAEIASIFPKSARIVAAHPDSGFWDGREVWNLLHRLGLRWGDMDCFQWVDPTYQTDYLIWVEVDDGDLGYALPERIATGSQHFRAIRFSFEIPRSPAPTHVLEQLLRVSSVCQQALGCTLTACLDDETVLGPADLHEGVLKVEKALATLGLKPGSDSVCQLI